MCGRFALCDQIEDLEETFGIVAPMWLEPRYNIAPGAAIACLTQNESEKSIEAIQWGMVPHWAKTKSQCIINTRAETAGSKPLLRQLLATQRCGVLASGYYEWHKDANGHKQPFYIHLENQKPFMVAAIWQYALREDGIKVKQCSILTTEATGALGSIHQRMPVIFNAQIGQLWLDEALTKPIDLVAAEHIKHLAYYPVSDYVNNARHESMKCIEPLK